MTLIVHRTAAKTVQSCSVVCAHFESAWRSGVCGRRVARCTRSPLCKNKDVVMELLRQITSVVPKADYRLVVTFDTGERGVFDMTPYLQYPCYRRLRDTGYFSLAKTERGTVVWPNDEDVAPEALWEQSEKE